MNMSVYVCMRNTYTMYYLLVACTDGDIQGDDVNKNSKQTRKHHLEYAWYGQYSPSIHGYNSYA